VTIKNSITKLISSAMLLYDKNKHKRKVEFVDVRCVKGKLMKDNNVYGEEKKSEIVTIMMNFDEL
ncbi:19708_t:CDS:1, partial [Dentiscutata erythropus]